MTIIKNKILIVIVFLMCLISCDNSKKEVRESGWMQMNDNWKLVESIWHGDTRYDKYIIEEKNVIRVRYLKMKNLQSHLVPIDEEVPKAK